MREDNFLYASFSEHFAELRYVIIQIVFVISIGLCFCIFFYEPLIAFLTYSKNREAEGLTFERYQTIRVTNNTHEDQIFQLPPNALPPAHLSQNVIQLSPIQYRLPSKEGLIYSENILNALLIFGPLEGMLVMLKVSTWSSIILTSPFWLFFLLRFIFPGLKKNEKRLIPSFLIFSSVFIFLGIAFAFFVTLPWTNHYLTEFNQTMGLNAWSMNHYLDYVLFILFAHAIVFELAVLGFFSVHCGFLKSKSLIGKRKNAILGAFILGALLTPPDIFSQFLLATALIGLYELLIVYARVRSRILRID